MNAWTRGCSSPGGCPGKTGKAEPGLQRVPAPRFLVGNVAAGTPSAGSQQMKPDRSGQSKRLHSRCPRKRGRGSQADSAKNELPFWRPAGYEKRDRQQPTRKNYGQRKQQSEKRNEETQEGKAQGGSSDPAWRLRLRLGASLGFPGSESCPSQDCNWRFPKVGLSLGLTPKLHSNGSAGPQTHCRLHRDFKTPGAAMRCGSCFSSDQLLKPPAPGGSPARGRD